MLRDIAVARVKQMLGFKKTLDSEIVQAMIEVQEDLERSSELPFFLRKDYASFVTAANVKTVAAPSDFIREDGSDQLFVTDGDGEEHSIVKDERGFLRLRWPTNEGSALPRRYARTDKTFYFYPTPDKIYTLNGTYYGKDASLATNVENKWMKELPFILLARSGLMLAAGLRDKEALTSFGAMNEIMTAKLHLMTTADDMAGMKPIIGDED